MVGGDRRVTFPAGLVIVSPLAATARHRPDGRGTWRRDRLRISDRRSIRGCHRRRLPNASPV